MALVEIIEVLLRLGPLNPMNTIEEDELKNEKGTCATSHTSLCRLPISLADGGDQ